MKIEKELKGEDSEKNESEIKPSLNMEKEQTSEGNEVEVKKDDVNDDPQN